MTKPLSVLLLTLCASVALAEPAGSAVRDPQGRATALVRKKLLTPLQRSQNKRSKFSRAAPAPRERRVRVLDAEAHTDARGKLFVRFAVDERFPWDAAGEWREASMQGCAYLAEGQVFVQQADSFVSASGMLGGSRKRHPEVCRAAPDAA